MVTSDVLSLALYVRAVITSLMLEASAFTNELCIMPVSVTTYFLGKYVDDGEMIEQRDKKVGI